MIVNDTRDYHRKKPPHMDNELTFAMMDSINPFLGDHKAYARLLCQNLHRRIQNPDREISIVEVGPGLGYPTQIFLTGMELLGQKYRYRAIELAPNLMGESMLQAMIKDGYPVEYIEGDAHKLNDLLKPGSVDILIANEMVGDMLTVSKIPKKLLTGEIGVIAHRNLVMQLRDMIKNHELPIVNTYNVGGLALIEHAYEVLAPGGVLYLSEHSCERPTSLTEAPYSKVPVEIKLGKKDDTHSEYTFSFDMAEKVAKSVGFSHERGAIVDMMGMKSGLLAISLTEVNELLYRVRIDNDKLMNIVEQNKEHFPEHIRNNPIHVKIFFMKNYPHLKTIPQLRGIDFIYKVERRVKPAQVIFGEFEYLIAQK